MSCLSRLTLKIIVCFLIAVLKPCLIAYISALFITSSSWYVTNPLLEASPSHLFSHLYIYVERSLTFALNNNQLETSIKLLLSPIRYVVKNHCILLRVVTLWLTYWNGRKKVKIPALFANGRMKHNLVVMAGGLWADECLIMYILILK